MEKPDVAQTETDGLEVLETREWVDSLDYVLSKGGPNRAGRLLQQLALHARREAGINLHFRGARRWNAALRAWFGGMRWPWWCGPTRCRKASAGTSRRSRRPPLCMKLRSTISFGRKRKAAIAMSFIFRVMPRLESIPGLISKAAFRRRSCKTFVAS